MSEALTYLRGIEDQTRWTNKYIVLDCSADNAKEIVVNHVRDITLGRRNYHYLLSGLVSARKYKLALLEGQCQNILEKYVCILMRNYDA